MVTNSWTNVSEIVSGKLWAAERIDDRGAVNLAPTDALCEVLGYTGHNPRIEFHPEITTGRVNRVTDNLLGKKKFGWEAQLTLVDSFPWG